MEYEITDTASVIQVTLTGRLEFDDHRKFRDLTAKLGTSAVKDLVVNLAKLDFIDSSGLGMLIALRNLADQRKTGFLLSKPSEPVRRILELARFSALARIEN